MQAMWGTRSGHFPGNLTSGLHPPPCPRHQALFTFLSHLGVGHRDIVTLLFCLLLPEVLRGLQSQEELGTCGNLFSPVDISDDSGISCFHLHLALQQTQNPEATNSGAQAALAPRVASGTSDIMDVPLWAPGCTGLDSRPVLLQAHLGPRRTSWLGMSPWGSCP